MKKLGTRITDEYKEKFIALCDRENLHQGEMIEKLIDYYLDERSENIDSKDKNNSERKSFALEQLGLNAEEVKEVRDAVINSGQELKAIAKDGLMYKAKYLNTIQTSLSDIPKEELRSSTAKGVAAYKIEKCVEAIIQHNENSPEPKDRVCLSKTLVQKLTGSNPKTVGQWFDEHHGLIGDHNSKYELTHSHNRRGAGFDYFKHLNLEYLKA